MRFRFGARLLPLATLLLMRPSAARAEVFHDAEVHAPGTFEVGIEGQVEFAEGASDPRRDRRVFGHAGLVIFDKTEVHARAGILNRDYNYFGGEIRYGALDNGDGYPALMLYAGGHWIDRARRDLKDFGGADGGITLSETVYDLSLYAGYDVDADFVPELTRVVWRQRAYGGTQIPISDHLAFRIESGYEFRSSDLPNRIWISGGAALFF